MDHTEARDYLLDHRRGLLPADVAARVASHLSGCEACRREDAADAALSAVLDVRLPRRNAPDRLHRAVGERMDREARRAPAFRPWPLATLAAVAIAAALLLLWRSPQPDAMVAEAVNDHLRVLYSTHPRDVEGGGVHRVKPWFEGKVDFAPVVGFGGDEDFPLTGGSVAYFIDRKAAAYIYERRLHVITLLVYRADGLPWSPVPTVSLGRARATERTVRGFNVLVWREGDLGYSLVSDLNLQELEALGAKIAGG